MNKTQFIEKMVVEHGTTPWILKDFRSPRRVLPGIQDFYNRKGLVSDKGEKKQEAIDDAAWSELAHQFFGICSHKTGQC